MAAGICRTATLTVARRPVAAIIPTGDEIRPLGSALGPGEVTDSYSLVVATPIRGGSGSISRLMRAHAWWPVPVGQGKFARGAHVDVQLIPGRPA